AAADVEKLRSRRPDPPGLQPARLAAASETEEHEHTPGVEFAVLLGLDAELLPGAQEVAEGLRHPGQPSPAAGVGPIGVNVLNLAVRPLGRAVVAALPGCMDRSHKFHVLLWHRRPLSVAAERATATALLLSRELDTLPQRPPALH